MMFPRSIEMHNHAGKAIHDMPTPKNRPCRSKLPANQRTTAFRTHRVPYKKTREKERMTSITDFFAPKKRKEKDGSASSPSSTIATDAEPSSKNNDCSKVNPYKRAKQEASSENKCTADNNDGEQDPVAVLLKFLVASITEDGCWRVALDKHFTSKSFEKLAKFVANQR